MTSLRQFANIFSLFANPSTKILSKYVWAHRLNLPSAICCWVVARIRFTQFIFSVSYARLVFIEMVIWYSTVFDVNWMDSFPILGILNNSNWFRRIENSRKNKTKSIALLIGSNHCENNSPSFAGHRKIVTSQQLHSLSICIPLTLIRSDDKSLWMSERMVVIRKHGSSDMRHAWCLKILFLLKIENKAIYIPLWLFYENDSLDSNFKDDLRVCVCLVRSTNGRRIPGMCIPLRYLYSN